jgi:hypothetical protein
MGPQRLAEKVLGNGEFIRSNLVLDSEKPAGAALLGGVLAVACTRLRQYRDKGIGVTSQAITTPGGSREDLPEDSRLHA